MLTITAVIRVKKGSEQSMLEQLLVVADHARRNEPATIDYFVTQAATDPCVFTTYERYTDQGAVDLHNNSPVVARFFEAARPMLDGAPTVVLAPEAFSKRG